MGILETLVSAAVQAFSIYLYMNSTIHVGFNNGRHIFFILPGAYKYGFKDLFVVFFSYESKYQGIV